MITEPLREDSFPRCIRGILQGVRDGRKRSLFILINFLSRCGWSDDLIRERIAEWNALNRKPLNEKYLATLLSCCFGRGSSLPPCCDDEVYINLAVCRPDGFCGRVRNPVTYAWLKGACGESCLYGELRDERCV